MLSKGIVNKLFDSSFIAFLIALLSFSNAAGQSASELFESERLNLEEQYKRLQDDLRDNIAQFDEVTAFIGDLTGDVSILRQRSSAIIGITARLETSLEDCERHAAAYIQARSRTDSNRVLDQFDRALIRCRQGLEDELSGLASLRVTVIAMLREEQRFTEEVDAIEPLLDDLKAEQDAIRERMREYNESLGIVQQIEEAENGTAPIDDGLTTSQGQD